MTDTSPRFAPDPNQNDNWRSWAERLIKYLNQPANARRPLAAQPVLLSSKLGDEKAFQAGMLMFNPSTKRVEYTRDGSFFPLEEVGNALQALTAPMKGRKFLTGFTSVAVGGTTVTFPTPFSASPTILVQPITTPAATTAIVAHAGTITPSSFVITSRRIADGGAVTDFANGVAWLAIGD